MRLRMTYTNWPTLRSDGTRYLGEGGRINREKGSRDKLLFVDVWNVTPLRLLTDDRNAVRILLPDSL